MPVAFDTRLLALVTPSARFHENDKPGPSFIQPPESGTVRNVVRNKTTQFAPSFARLLRGSRPRKYYEISY